MCWLFLNQTKNCHHHHHLVFYLVYLNHTWECINLLKQHDLQHYTVNGYKISDFSIELLHIRYEVLYTHYNSPATSYTQSTASDQNLYLILRATWTVWFFAEMMAQRPYDSHVLWQNVPWSEANWEFQTLVAKNGNLTGSLCAISLLFCKQQALRSPEPSGPWDDYQNQILASPPLYDCIFALSSFQQIYRQIITDLSPPCATISTQL